MPEKIFIEDEFQVGEVDPDWSVDELLEQEAIFYLKDVFQLLGIDSVKVKKAARRIEQEGGHPWQVMGARKLWSHWIIRMKAFAPYYREHLTPPYKEVPDEWDANDLLSSKSRFKLTEVCAKLPLKPHQIRNQAKKLKYPRRDIGVWKDKELNLFLVDMDVFGPFFGELWKTGDFRIFDTFERITPKK
jgi:hypothetical protein